MPTFDASRAARQIERIAAALAVPLASATDAALLAYCELVAGWSRRVNLTAARDEAELCEVLLADALVIAGRELVEHGAHVVDVGTGAGAPIIPLLLLRSDLRATCFEPLHKRAALLRTAAVKLGLHARMHVREERVPADQTSRDRGPYDLACSRATFDPSTWLQVGLTLAPRVLVFLADAEPPEAPSEASCTRSERYTLPISAAPRQLALYERRL